ncbi:MAG: hypothetical protein ACRC62_39325 [Microcoleus sp.]
MNIGDRVTNENGWHGVIVPRPKHWGKFNGVVLPVVYVRWEERQKLIDAGDRDNHAIKDPVTSARPETLTIVS